MKQSQLFTKTLKEAPRDETAVNARLLERGGYIYKNLAGVYTFLPLGSLVLQKIIEIIRKEMDGIGGQEMFLNTLQDPQIWKKTRRWSDEEVDVWFRTKLKNEVELGLATTHEEPLAELMSHYIHSYKDLPLYLYQFQTKFRNELRPKSGLLRTREFIMKDLYSFNRNEQELEDFYEKVAVAYLKIFAKVGLGDYTYRTFASGGAFSKFSDEFQTICSAGEDIIFLDQEQNIAVNRDVYKDEILKELGLNKKNLREIKSIEVGNIFKLGTRYSEALGLMFVDEHGNKKPVVMGSYGIGPARVMGTIVELHHDDKGIIWPESVAPFRVHLLDLTKGHNSPSPPLTLRGGRRALLSAEQVYQTLLEAGIEVLYDDRDVSAGVKFADADLIGIPWRVVVSEKTEKAGKVEVKSRSEGHSKLIELKDLISRFKTKISN